MNTPTISARASASARSNLISLCLLLTCTLIPTTSFANPFSSGWDLQPEASSIRFQSIKNSTKVESSTFASISGEVDSSGLATLKVLLDSVDTKIDLRNVRMRFLFFETFQYPEATVSLQLEPEILADLAEVRRKLVTVPYFLNLHGVTNELEAEIAVTEISEDIISVTSSTPISLSLDQFDLLDGIRKLEETANVSILPSATISFDLLFSRRTAETTSSTAVASSTAAASETQASAALETEGDFSFEACKGRFEILSQTNNIYFAPSSAQLESKSELILDSIADIIQRCPDLTIEISGHTDSDGGAAANQQLSEARAESVKSYFLAQDIVNSRMQTVGYGESKPAVANDTRLNKQRNRRIEFAVIE